jgi:hypothetical protein
MLALEYLTESDPRGFHSILDLKGSLDPQMLQARDHQRRLDSQMLQERGPPTLGSPMYFSDGCTNESTNQRTLDSKEHQPKDPRLGFQTPQDTNEPKQKEHHCCSNTTDTQ